MEAKESAVRTNGVMVEEKLIVNYKNSAYDLTEFIFKHPGGVNSLRGRNRKNIDASFHSVEHSKAAEYLMREYKIDTQSDLDESMEVMR
jgi:cytochrome b involved in lipid metabolism